MTRILSAVVLVAIVVGTVWWLPAPWTIVLASLAAALAAAEVADLAARVGAAVPRLTLAATALIVSVAMARDLDLLTVALLAVVVSSGLMMLAAGPPAPAMFTRAAVLIMAPVYIGLPLGALASIRMTHGPGAVLFLLVIIAVSDSAQFYAGRVFGRRKLAPAVSPAKTVEGAIGKLHEFIHSTGGAHAAVENATRIGAGIANQLKAAGVNGVILTST